MPGRAGGMPRRGDWARRSLRAAGRLLAVAFLVSLASFRVASVARTDTPARAGSGRLEVALRGRSLVVHTYRPASHRDGPLLLVFHGMLRNASEYRDHARGMAERFHAVVAAPEFDAERFPSWKYNRGGLVRPDGGVAPPEERTWELVPLLIAELRQREGRPDWPVYLIGHSAGGQFLARMAAVLDTPAVAIIASNPSAWVAPDADHDFPYGLGGLPESFASEQALRRYLAQPLVFYLGENDDQRDEDLDTSPGADLQGATRLRRGRAVHAAGESLARRRGWTFRWRLVVARGVGHDHSAMFDHQACAQALFGGGTNAAPPARGADVSACLSQTRRSGAR